MLFILRPEHKNWVKGIIFVNRMPKIDVISLNDWKYLLLKIVLFLKILKIAHFKITFNITT